MQGKMKFRAGMLSCLLERHHISRAMKVLCWYENKFLRVTIISF